MFRDIPRVLQRMRRIQFTYVPETAQEFCKLQECSENIKKKIPFGIGQIGKSFLNEITETSHSVLREFRQMELEFFCEPDKDLEWFEYWKITINDLQTLEIKEDEMRISDHERERRVISLF